MTWRDPYRAPEAALGDAPETPPFARLYSPRQVGWGSFLGGPLAVLYLVRANFVALQRHAAARRALAMGVPLALVSIVLLALRVERWILPLHAIIGMAAYQFVTEHQLPRQANAADAHLDFHSGWRVVALVPIASIATKVVALAGVFAIELSGLADFGVLAEYGLRRE